MSSDGEAVMRNCSITRTIDDRIGSVTVTGEQLLLRDVVSQQRSLVVVQIVHLVVELNILEQMESVRATSNHLWRRPVLSKKKPVFWMWKTHLSGPMGSKFEATADDVKAEADEPVEHAFKERSTAISG